MSLGSRSCCSQERGGSAAGFDLVFAVVGDAFEDVDGGALGVECAEGEGLFGGVLEVGEGLLDVGLVEPGEDVGDRAFGELGEAIDVAIGADVEIDGEGNGCGVSGVIGLHGWTVRGWVRDARLI